MARVIARGVLSFGLVSIPVDIHSAIEDQSIHMHWLHKKCGSRVRNQMICPVCKVVVERDDLVRDFEVSKGKYVQITEEELESLEAEANTALSFVSSCRSKDRSALFRKQLLFSAVKGR